jgi:hypothetical protein
LLRHINQETIMTTRMRLLGALLLTVSMVFATSSMAAAQEDQGTVLAAELLGETEVPGPGDPDGSGGAAIVISPDQDELCFAIEVDGITLPAAAAHIHAGAAGEAGPVVVPLGAPGAEGVAEGCIAPDSAEQVAVLSEIVANPSHYYVNVHTSDYPDGAVRGQLAPVTLPGTGVRDTVPVVLTSGAVLALLVGMGVRRRARA